MEQQKKDIRVVHVWLPSSLYQEVLSHCYIRGDLSEFIRMALREKLQRMNARANRKDKESAK